MDEQQTLQHAIAALQTQRAVLGDSLVDAALAPLQAKLATLAVPAQAVQQRRQVTVLFLDAVGSTRLAVRLDPEDIHAVLDGLLVRCTAAIEAHHGRVLQYTGDGLLAAFGARHAREDDAQQAVSAGLSLVALGREAALQVHQQHGHEGFGVRVGIHTGSVLLGGGVDEAGSIRGMAVHIAARLEQAAPAGGVRISHDTWRLVRGRFDTQALPPLAAKGRDEPLASWLVQCERPRDAQTTARGVDGLATPLVGRETELQALRDALAATLARSVQTVSVVGEPGLGKTRLLSEFERMVDACAPRAVRLHAAGRPGGELQAYGLLRDLFSRWLHLSDDASAEVARQHWLDGLAPWLGEHGPADAARLGHLLGLDFSAHPALQTLEGGAERLRQQATATLVRLVRALAGSAGQPKPVLLLLDDLHWADDASLDLLEHLLRALPQCALLLCGLERPVFLQRRPHWPQCPAPHCRLELRPLGAADGATLARALLGPLPNVPAVLRRVVEQGGDGNPFFMEELVNMLIDDGVIVVGSAGAPWQLRVERLTARHVPTTLTGVLQSRVDALAAPERATLQLAAVIGSRFWDVALDALGAAAATTLPLLLQRGLVQRSDSSAFEGAAEYRFVHQLLQQVVYEGLLRPERRRAHAGAAAWLAERVGERAGEHLATTADHYERAGDPVQATAYHLRAAQDAHLRAATALALESARRGLQTASERPQGGDAAAPPRGDEQSGRATFAHERPKDAALPRPSPAGIKESGKATFPCESDSRWSLLILTASLHNLRGEREAEKQTIDTCAALAQDQSRIDRQLEVLMLRAELAERLGQHEAAVEHCAAVVALRSAAEASAVPESRAGIIASLALAHATWAFVLLNRKSYAEATHHAAEGLALARRSTDASLILRLTSRSAMVAHGAWDIEQAERLYAQATAQAESLQRRIPLTVLLQNWAVLRAHLGELDGALQLLERALPLTREYELRNSEAGALANLALVQRWRGELDAALAAATEAARLGTSAGARIATISAHLERCRVLAALGRHDEAQATLAQAQSACDAHNLPVWQAEVDVQHAALALVRGERSGALATVRALLAGPHAAGLQTTDRVECWRVLAANQAPEADGWRQSTRALLMANALRIPNMATREAYLTRIPEHRELMAAAPRGPAAAVGG